MLVEDVTGLFVGVPPSSLEGLAVAVMTGLADGSMVGIDVGPTVAKHLFEPEATTMADRVCDPTNSTLRLQHTRVTRTRGPHWLSEPTVYTS